METPKAFVTDRLSSVAEETSAYSERMIPRNGEKLRCSEEEDQRKQHTLSQDMSPGAVLHRLGPGLNQSLPQDFTESQEIKEEPEKCGVKQEEEQLPVVVLLTW